jgi:hypothetical protein
LGVLDCFGLDGDVVVFTGYRPETFADVGATVERSSASTSVSARAAWESYRSDSDHRTSTG